VNINIVNIKDNLQELIDLGGFAPLVPLQGDVIQTAKRSYKVLYRSFCTETNTLRLYVREEK